MAEHQDTDVSTFTIEHLKNNDISVFFHGMEEVLIHLEDGRVVEIDRHGNFAVRWQDQDKYLVVDTFPEH
jgi:hypothetical protein